MSTQNPTTVTRTVVLAGVGPNIKVKLPQNGTVTFVTGTKVKTVNLDSSANVEFAA